MTDIQHSVKTGIPHYGHIVLDTLEGEQSGRLLVLHKEMCYHLQHASIACSIPAEENFIAAEDAAHAIYRDTMLVAGVDYVVPEFILDEERHLGLHQTEETGHIAWRIHGQIADDVGSFIILAHFITGGAEECEQYLILGMKATETLHQGTSLLKLSQGGSMEPYVALVLINLLTQSNEGLETTFNHCTRLAVERGYQQDTQRI